MSVYFLVDWSNVNRQTEISCTCPEVSADAYLKSPSRIGGMAPPVNEISILSDSSENANHEPPDQPVWPSDPKSRLQRLEAILFLAKEPLPSRKLSQFAQLEDGTQARTMVNQLNEQYDRLGRAFSIQRVAGGYQMRTRPQFAEWIRRQEHISRPMRLSTPMQETLAVVAYRQPIIKAEIEAVRGVSSGEVLRQLMETGLVKMAGRSSDLGRPFLYATTKKFLTDFGLNSLDDLPRSEQLVGRGLPASTPTSS